MFRGERLAREVEPDDQAGLGLGTEKFVEQHALAETGGGAEQAELGILGGETVDQPGARDMGRRQSRQARRKDRRCLAGAGHGAVLTALLLWVNRTLAD
ncbi:hypothetical protein Pres01_54410 [Metapseudomonas resinovorans]|nr:hypothetical protein Pres01_54410 [Pseudomonas resinovorans]